MLPLTGYVAGHAQALSGDTPGRSLGPGFTCATDVGVVGSD